MIGWWGLLGCVAEAPPPPPAPEPVAEVQAPPLPAEPRDPSKPAEVLLRFSGVGPLHQSFFSHEPSILALEKALSVCVSGSVTVTVSWVEQERVGQITVQLPRDASACLPAFQGNDLDLHGLTPAAVALARYRDAIAGNYDYRVASFSPRVQVAAGDWRCTFVAAGDHPPSGERFSPCVETPNGPYCASHPDGAAVLRGLEDRARQAIAACAPNAGAPR